MDRQTPEPLAQQALDFPRIQAVANLLQGLGIVTTAHAVVQGLEGHGAFVQLAFRVFVAVQAELGVVREICAELQEDGDVGAGDSKLTWQAWPGVGYRFEKFDAVAGYRHLAWETEDGDTFEDLSFSGPMLGVKFGF